MVSEHGNAYNTFAGACMPVAASDDPQPGITHELASSASFESGLASCVTGGTIRLPGTTCSISAAASALTAGTFQYLHKASNLIVTLKCDVEPLLIPVIAAEKGHRQTPSTPVVDQQRFQA